MIHIRLDDAKTPLPNPIDAAIRGETVLIETEKPQHTPKFGSAKGLIPSMADDFDAPLEEFREYMK